MSHCNTIFSQILNLVPRHEFETLAKQYHSGRSFRTASGWPQFVPLAMVQPGSRISLCDIVESVSVQAHRLYHLVSAKLTRSNLSRINEDKPHALYEALAGKLLNRCQGMASGHKFRFKNPLYSASLIGLCLSVFPWANFRSVKGAIKLNIGLNHDDYLLEFVIIITDAQTSDAEVGRTLTFPSGRVVAVDRSCNDYDWYHQLTKKGIFFVTRLKTNAQYRVIDRQSVLKNKGLTSDQIIHLTGIQATKKYPVQLRRIGYRDIDTGKHYFFLINNFKLAARTITDIYKARWQVKLFFKWIKQNLKIKSFIGINKNAVMTQIRIALCVYLLIAFIKFQSTIQERMQQILRLLQLNLFEKQNLMALMRGGPPNNKHICNNQMVLL